jgi:hypothetical protein
MQTPRFGISDVHDSVLHEEIRLMTDLMVAAAEHPHGGMPSVALDRALGLGVYSPLPSTSTTYEGATALMVAVNAQNRLAPRARAACERNRSAMSIYRMLISAQNR